MTKEELVSRLTTGMEYSKFRFLTESESKIIDGCLGIINDLEKKLTWRTFDTPPAAGQEIMVVWPSGVFEPEFRKLTEDDLKQDWRGMRWYPVPAYPPIPFNSLQ